MKSGLCDPALPAVDTTSKPASSGWHLALARATEATPYLGDPKVVQDLVTDLVHTVVNAEVAETKETLEELAWIFAGQDDEYESVGHWNTGGGLVAAIHEAPGDHEGGPRGGPQGRARRLRPADLRVDEEVRRPRDSLRSPRAPSKPSSRATLSS